MMAGFRKITSNLGLVVAGFGKFQTGCRWIWMVSSEFGWFVVSVVTV